MRIKVKAISAASAIVTAIAFGICGLLFVVAPGPTSAFVSWVLHVDVTAMTRPVSLVNLLAGIAIFGAYVGALVGVTAALYNRLAESPTP